MSTTRPPAKAVREELLSEFHHHREEPHSARSHQDMIDITDQLQQIEDVWNDDSYNNRFEEVFGDIDAVKLQDMLSRWYTSN